MPYFKAKPDVSDFSNLRGGFAKEAQCMMTGQGADTKREKSIYEDLRKGMESTYVSGPSGRYPEILPPPSGDQPCRMEGFDRDFEKRLSYGTCFQEVKGRGATGDLKRKGSASPFRGAPFDRHERMVAPDSGDEKKIESGLIPKENCRVKDGDLTAEIEGEKIDPPQLNSDIDTLKDRLLAQLGDQGFSVSGDRLCLVDGHKATIRDAHTKACAYLQEKSKKGLASLENSLLASIANGQDLNPRRITPRLIEVKAKSWEELLFRYGKLHWSIPVSAGYGRRLRFLVWDDAHDKLIGILGLSDPVFSLKARDAWMGCDKEQRRRRLANVMDAFVLGAVPPYSSLLGGKLVALAVASNEIREAFDRRYSKRNTLIGERQIGPLVLVTTTSALGRSSIYNRLKIEDRTVFYSVGFTSGSGEFPYLNGVYQDLLNLVSQVSGPSAKNPRWGNGFRNRREVVLKALGLLGLPKDLIYHGVNREIFVVPLGVNAKEFLRNETNNFEAFNMPFSDLAAWWKERWALPRSIRDPHYSNFERESWRLWSQR